VNDDMSTETTTDTIKFNFTDCFYHDSDNADEMICNVTVVCAIMLVLFGSFQGACEIHMINEITTMARRTFRSVEEKINALRGALGSLMRFDVNGPKRPNGPKLVANGASATPVNQVRELYQCDSPNPNKYLLTSLLLAYLNFSDTVMNKYRSILLGYTQNNQYLYSVLNIILLKFPTKNFSGRFYIDGICKIPAFTGTDFVFHHKTHVSKLDIILPEGSEEIENKNVIDDCLAAIQTAIDQINDPIMQAISSPQQSSHESTTTDMEPFAATSNVESEISDNHCKAPVDQSAILNPMPYSPLPTIIEEQNSDNRCDISKKCPYIFLFVIVAAALLAGSAIALTTYFHVGTTLMLAAGFIPFLNFVGGFQISLLLGVVTAATLGAGGIYAIAKNTKCCDKCCNSEPLGNYDEVK
jgi:hypothetical protein